MTSAKNRYPPQSTLSFMTLVVCLALPVQALGQVGPAEMMSADGLRSATLTTAQGTIQVNLPDDLTGPLSGTIRTFPVGLTAEEKAKNADTLNLYAIRMQGRDTPVAAGLFQRIVPHTQKTVDVIFLDPTGKELSRASANTPQLAARSCLAVRSRNIVIPSAAQAGRPLEIHGIGLFDGDLRTTSVKINGQQAPALSESSQKTIVECPADVAGRANIEVRKNQAETQGTVRVLNVSLNAPELDLRSGEQTTLTTRVRGLTDLQEDLSFRLQNQTPSVVQLAGGDTQTITIRPRDVQGDIYTYARVIMGKRPGGFNVLASVQNANPVTFPVVSPDQVLATNQTARRVEPPRPGVPEQYFLAAGMVELDRATMQQQPPLWNQLPSGPCCCCCWGQPFQGQGPGGPGPGGPGPGPNPGPNPPAGPAPITTNVNLGADKFGAGKSIYVFAAPATPISGMKYHGEAYVQWNVLGGSGQLTVDLDVQRPRSTRWERLANGRGPNDEYLFTTDAPGTYLFRVTGKDSSGKTNFNTLSITFPSIPGIT